MKCTFPEAADVEEMESAHGPNLFYESVEYRRELLLCPQSETAAQSPIDPGCLDHRTAERADGNPERAGNSRMG